MFPIVVGVSPAADDAGLGALDPRQSWALILIAARPDGLEVGDVSFIYGIVSRAARSRVVQPLVDLGYVLESPSGRLTPSELGARAAGPSLADPLVRREVEEAMAELAWFRSEG